MRDYTVVCHFPYMENNALLRTVLPYFSVPITLILWRQPMCCGVYIWWYTSSLWYVISPPSQKLTSNTITHKIYHWKIFQLIYGWVAKPFKWLWFGYWTWKVRNNCIPSKSHLFVNIAITTNSIVSFVGSHRTLINSNSITLKRLSWLLVLKPPALWDKCICIL